MASTPRKTSRSYWADLLEHDRNLPIFLRIPILTIALAIACIVIFYVGDDGTGQGELAQAMTYIPGPNSSAYRSLSATISHTSATHLWVNMALLLVAGCFFEFTEGFLRTLCVVLGSATMGFGLHGAIQANRARGISGVCYGLVAAQLSLLALNWSEMPFRWIRAVILLVLIGVDVGVYVGAKVEGTAYSVHLFGALAAFFIALNLGRNVNKMWWELALLWLGFLGYCGLEGVALGYHQTAAGLLGLIVAVPLLIHAVVQTYLHYADNTAKSGGSPRGGVEFTTTSLHGQAGLVAP